MKKLNLVQCISLIVGSMIGSAIFSLSGLTMFTAGPSAVLSWFIACVIMFFYGLICCELATRYPQSGGTYIFPSRAFKKPLLGWISNWGCLLANIVAIAFSAIYFSTYLGAGFGLSGSWQVPIALISVFLCTVLNLIDISYTGKFNTFLVSGLVLTLMIFVGIAISTPAFEIRNLTPFFGQGTKGKWAFLTAVPTAMLGYGNIVTISFIVGEVKDPSKNIPKSVLFSMAIVAFIYLSAIFATLGCITISFLKNNPGMTYIPMYAACFTSLSSIPWLSKVISISAILALFTTNLILVTVTSRGLKAAADDKILPAVFAKTNSHSSPSVAIVFVGVLSSAISCFPQFTEHIVGYGALFAVVSIVINILSVIKARKNKDSSDIAVFNAPGKTFVPITLIIVLIACYIPDMTSGWQIWLFTAVSYLIGVIIYRFSNRNNL